MKIVVIGGTGLIGSKVVAKLQNAGHLVVIASPATGINTITGEGLVDAINDTEVVIDLANSPSFEDQAVMEFFRTSGRNILAAEVGARVKHHVVLSIVGVDLMQNIGYMRAKKAQEDLVKQSGIPFTIIRSTQFMEFMAGIADKATENEIVHLSDVQFQPIASSDVAGFVVDFALSWPKNDVVEIAGPQRFEMYDIIGRFLTLKNDRRKVLSNGKPQYFGGNISHSTLVPAGQFEAGATTFEKWSSSELQPA
jgi:uncharacterized protein YbjT (DUF2867 family)